METARIVLETKLRTPFTLEEGYVDVSDEELIILLQRCRDIAASLEAEMNTRQLLLPGSISDEAYNALRRAAIRFEIMDRLDSRSSKHVDTAIAVLTQAQTDRPGLVYQEFLHDVLRLGSPGLVMLCAVGLGKAKLVTMPENERVTILELVKVKGSTLQSPALESLANESGMPSLESPHLVLIPGTRKRKRKASVQLGLPGEPSNSAAESGNTAAAETNTSGQTSFPLSRSSMTILSHKSANRYDGILEPGQEDSVDTETAHAPRHIKYMFSKPPIANVPILAALIYNASQASNQWKMERRSQKATTECLTLLIPFGESEDMSISLKVGRAEGYNILQTLKFKWIWSALHTHGSPPHNNQQEFESLEIP